MCGIAGIIRYGKKPIEEEQVSVLWVDNEHRGNDAGGIAIQQADGSIDILKKDVPPWTLIASKEYIEFIQNKLKEDSECVLVHARGASQGNPRDNENNHPMFAGHGALIHNGVIRNDAFLFDAMKLERRAETDSDILRAIVDKYGITEEAIKMMSRCSGSGTIAAVHPEFPGKVLLVRSGNPLTIASNEDFFFFASEKNTLHKACRPSIKRYGMWFQSQRPNVDFANMADDTGWILGPRGLETHVECKISTGNYTEPWRKTYETYAERQTKWNILKLQSQPNVLNVYVGSRNNSREETPMKSAWCPQCKRNWVIPLDEIFSDYTCDEKKNGCGGRLSSPIIKVN